MSKKRDQESCWTLARRRAEHVRKRAARRKPGVLRDLLTSPEGVLAVVAGLAAMNVLAAVGRMVGEALVALWVVAARRRAEAARVQPETTMNMPPVVPSAAYEVREAMTLNLQSALGLIEARSRGHRVRADAPSSADAWTYLEARLEPGALTYLRQAESEGGGAWTPIRYDLVKRPSEAPGIWSERGRVIREEAEAEAMRPKVKPNTPKPGGGDDHE